MTLLLDRERPAARRRVAPLDARQIAAPDYGIDSVPAVVETDHVRRRTDEADGRIGALDGLRGVAVLLVIAFHEGWLRGGFLGVDVFFVVSGYVITRLLLPGDGRRGASLAHFWSRRVRRLLPAMLLLVAAVQLWVRVGAPASQWRMLHGQTRAALAYLSNWHAVVTDAGYWESGSVKTPLLHLWSLAVEEQFYVVWPLVLLGALRLARGRVRPWMAIGTTVLAAVSMGAVPVVYERWGADRAYYGTDTRVGLILLGAALSLWHARGERDDGRRVSSWSVGVSVTCLVLAVLTLTPSSRALFWGGQAATGLATLALVARAADGRRMRVLSSGLLQWIGLRSYGLYLWSWPTTVILTSERLGIGGSTLVVVKLVVLLVLTQLSYHLVERPIREGRFRGGRLLPVILLPIGAVAVLTFTVLPAAPAQMTNGPLMVDGSGGTDALRILVVGDSWARNIGAGLARADDEGRDSILNDGIAACGIQGLPTRSGEGLREVPAACASWPSRWREDVRSFSPDAVLLVTGRWDQAEVKLGDRFVRPDDEAFQRRYRERLDMAIEILHAGGAPVYVVNVVDNLRPEEQPWVDAINELLADAVERNRGARLLDIRSALCPDDSCPSRLQGATVYDDTHHLTPTWQRRLGTLLLDHLHAEVDGADDATVVRERAADADAMLPAQTLVAGAGVEVMEASFPRPEDLAVDLLGPISDAELSYGRSAARVTTASDGETVRALTLRFADDAVPDRLALRSVPRLERDGWERVALPQFDRIMFVRGGDVVLLARGPYAITAIEVHTTSRSVSVRAVELMTVADEAIRLATAAARQVAAAQ